MLPEGRRQYVQTRTDLAPASALAHRNPTAAVAPKMDASQTGPSQGLSSKAKKFRCVHPYLSLLLSSGRE